MEIIVGKTSGFCYGVNNAVTKAEEFVKNNKDKKVYCLGELVHNKQVTSKLEKEGLAFIDDLSEIEKPKQMVEDENSNNILKENDKTVKKKGNAAVIIRAHGEPKSTYEKLRQNNLEILDLTCPNVLAIHKLVEEHILKRYYVFLIGQKDHPEIIGTYGFCDGKCTVIENEDDIDLAFNELIQKNMNKIFVVSQTTFSLEKFEKYVKIIEKKINEINENCQKDIRKKEQAKVHADSLNVGQAKNVKEIEHQKKLEKVLNYNQTCNSIELEIKNTICNATRIRQEETEKISKQVDCMIIIGGKNSSNTRKLYDIAKKNCENTVIIETYKELEESLNGTNSMQENNNGKDVNKKFLEKIKTSNKIGIMAGASTPKESIEEVIDFIKLEH